MDGENQLFMHNVANYLATRSIIVPTDFTDPGGRRLTNGQLYQFDLQPMAAGNEVHVQGAAVLVLLTVMAHRGTAAGRYTHGITAMWLAGPPMGGRNTAPLPAGANYVFTESLGGCSVYIQGGNIIHDYSGNVPGGVAANQQVSEPYAGSVAGHFEQTCAVAYLAGGAWHIGTSVPHDVMGYQRTHTASGYHFLGH
ncbi:hypothetical protein [Trinickia mobilis]|uniref:hypothetical protein n=1 Tax=Trinickia mobilis TaxID=2816356 RepID=UPI001A8BFADE|nr:hypothetical protein [Trinickia mobilis]